MDRMSDFRRRLANEGYLAQVEQLLSRRRCSRDALISLVKNDDAEHPDLLKWFFEVLAAFDAVCATAYFDYTSASLQTAVARTPRRLDSDT
jgi:hypothetical protein